MSVLMLLVGQQEKQKTAAEMTKSIGHLAYPRLTPEK